MLIVFTFLESKTVPNVIRFAGFFIGVIRFSELKCYNTSWHRNIQLLSSFIFQSETAVEGFIASQAPQTRKVSSLTSP